MSRRCWHYEDTTHSQQHITVLQPVIASVPFYYVLLQIFYYGHTAVVYINKFRVAGLLEEGVDQFIEQVGVAGVTWHEMMPCWAHISHALVPAFESVTR